MVTAGVEVDQCLADRLRKDRSLLQLHQGDIESVSTVSGVTRDSELDVVVGAPLGQQPCHALQMRQERPSGMVDAISAASLKQSLNRLPVAR